MTPERWEQIGELYLAAQEVEAAQRPSFLAQACAHDTELRREVESLLQAEAEAGEFINQPLLAETLTDDPLEQPPPLERDIIGHYQLQMRLGTGGMGEVYLAHDTRLGRQVAIKLLPPQSARDQQARQRFLREARAVAALTHPNIVTIHAIEETSDAVFIVMEYVRGETLAARIKQGALAWPEVLTVGAQIADALAAAHAVGLIHRDIKPENVMLTPEGQARLLDFGIARMTHQWLLRGGTTLPQLTAEGAVVGTVAYMSPEQVCSEPLDTRSDLFSLGALLYEAATGKPPFTGSNLFATMHAIVTKEPVAPSTLNPALPAHLDQVLQRALAKDKTARYASATEFAAALRTLPAPTTENELAPTTATTVKLSSPPNRAGIMVGRKTLAAAAAVALVLLATIAFIAYQWRKASTPPPLVQETQLTTTGNIRSAAISPDGKYVAYVAQDNDQENTLWVKQLATSSTTPILPTAKLSYNNLTFSRDGNYIYYTTREKGVFTSTLYRVPLLGGPSQKIMTGGSGAISFSPDGQRFVFRRYVTGLGESRLLVVNADGSGEQQIAVQKNPEWFGDPVWSPDGKVIACSAGDREDVGGHRYLVAIRVDDWKLAPISTPNWTWDWSLDWLPDSKGLLAVGSQHPSEPSRVWQISYPGGTVKRLTANTNSYTRLSLTADASTLLATTIKLNTNLWMVPGNAPQQARKVSFGAGGFRSGLRWLPNGKIVFASETTDSLDISVMNEEGSNAKPLLGELIVGAAAMAPTTSPDGRYIIFSSTLGSERRDKLHLWRMDFNGGNLLQLTKGNGEDQPTCTVDGKWVIFTDIGAVRPTLWKVPIEGGTPVQITQVQSAFPSVSPDGKWIACFYSAAGEQVQWRLALFPLEGGVPVKVFPQELYWAQAPKWTPDGRTLTYTDLRQTNLWLQPISGGTPQQFTDFTNDLIFSYEWSPDGKRLACVRGFWERNLVLVKNIR
ncbi:MAG TPA: protein kinase [Blastocatellia bacterium]|nr:protein kinase [Blastocatellia bacterium]